MNAILPERSTKALFNFQGLFIRRSVWASAFAVVGFSFFCGNAVAANGTWTTSTGDWTTAGNWTPGIPGSTDTAYFANDPADAPVTVNIDGAQSINIFNFANTDSRTYTFSGSNLTFLTKDGATDARILTGSAAASAITFNNNLVIGAGFGGPDAAARLTIGGTQPSSSNFTTLTINRNILSGSGAGLKSLAFNSSATAQIIINGNNSAQFLGFGGEGEVIAGSTSALGAGSVQKTSSSLLSLRSDVTVGGSSYSWTTSGHTTSIRISEVSASSANRTLTFNNRTISTGGSLLWVDNVNSTGKLILELKYSGGTAQSLKLAPNASGIVRFAQSGATTQSGVISGAGQVEQTVGTGITTLSAANTYTGKTIISAGTLLLSSTGSIANSSAIDFTTSGLGTLDVSSVSGRFQISANQTLQGTGTVIGALTVASTGILAPGNSAGTITFNNNLTLASGSVSNFEINGLTTGLYDLAKGGTGSQTVNFGGTLNLIFQSGFNTVGTVKIFDFETYAETFGVNTSGLASGYTASFNATDGVVTVVPEPGTASLLLGGLALALLGRRTRSPRQSC